MTTRRAAGNPIDEDSAPLSPQDHILLSQAEGALERGLALRDGWKATAGRWADRNLTVPMVKEIAESGIHPEVFRLSYTSPRWAEEVTYGFTDRAPVNHAQRQVMGYVVQIPFDTPGPLAQEQALDLEQVQEDLRSFVLRYFLHLSELSNAGTPYNPVRRSLDRFLRPVSWLPEVPSKAGVGHKKL